jgi:hypothetical protein
VAAIVAIITGLSAVAVALVSTGAIKSSRSAKADARLALSQSMATDELVKEQARAIVRLERREEECQRRLARCEERLGL